jgi:hypothetical protein
MMLLSPMRWIPGAIRISSLPPPTAAEPMLALVVPGLVVPTGSNPCLHLEGVLEPDVVTSNDIRRLAHSCRRWV